MPCRVLGGGTQQVSLSVDCEGEVVARPQCVVGNASEQDRSAELARASPWGRSGPWPVDLQPTFTPDCFHYDVPRKSTLGSGILWGRSGRRFARVRKEVFVLWPPSPLSAPQAVLDWKMHQVSFYPLELPPGVIDNIHIAHRTAQSPLSSLVHLGRSAEPRFGPFLALRSFFLRGRWRAHIRQHKSAAQGV